MKKILSIIIFVSFSLCAYTQSTSAVLSVVGNSTICAGVSSNLKVDITGGTAPYKVEYSDGMNTQTISSYTSGTSIPITPSLTATYNLVSVQDASMMAGTGLSGMPTVTVNPLPTVNITSSNGLLLTCGTLNTVLTASSGSSYLWNDVSTNAALNVSGAGVYTVTVTAANGCTKSESKEIKENKTAPNAPVGGAKTINCANKQVTLDAKSTTQNVSYLWTSNETTDKVTVTEGGTYKVMITDNENKCTSSTIFNVTKDIIVPTIALTEDILLTCKAPVQKLDATISNSISGHTYSYTWSGPSGALTDKTASINVSKEGTYSVVVKDNINGCENTKDVKVDKAKQDLAITTKQENNPCFGDKKGEIGITVTGGTPTYTFKWSNGQNTQNITGLASESYTVTITDSYECTLSTSISITEPAKLVLDGTVTNTKCYGGKDGKVELSASGGTSPYRYNKINNDPFLTTTGFADLGAGTYSFYVKDDKNCITKVESTIASPTQLTATISAKPTTSSGTKTGEASVVVTGGTTPYSYDWSNSKGTSFGTLASTKLEDLPEGTYYVTVTDKNGCSISRQVEVTDAGCTLVLTGGVVNPVSCFGKADGTFSGIKITGEKSALTYILNGETKQNPNFTGLAKGNYTLIISESGTCRKSVQFSIDEPSQVGIGFQKSTDEKCFNAKDGSVTIEGTGGTPPYSYYQDGILGSSNEFSGLSPKIYKYHILDKNSCQSATQDKNIAAATKISIDGTISPVSGCDTIDGKINLNITGGNGGFNYNWSNGSKNFQLYNLDGGKYTVTVTDIKGCTNSKDFVIINNNKVPKELKLYLKPSGDILFVNSNDPNLKGVCLFWQKDGKNIIPIQDKLWIYIGKEDYTKYSLKLVYNNPLKTIACDISNKCQTICKTISKLVNSDEIVQSIGFEVYPNPNNGLFSLKLTDFLEDSYQLYISNMQGQELKQIQISAPQQEVEVVGLASGVYLLRLVDKQGHVGSKLIVIHE